MYDFYTSTDRRLLDWSILTLASITVSHHGNDSDMLGRVGSPRGGSVGATRRAFCLAGRRGM